MTSDIEGDNFNKAMDWSCNNMLAVSNNDHLIIYDNDGEKVLSSIIRCKSITYNDFGQIIDLKWASDGECNIKKNGNSVTSNMLLVILEYKAYHVSHKQRLSRII